MKNRPVTNGTQVLNSVASNDTAKVKSFARQKREAFEEFKKAGPNDIEKIEKSVIKFEDAKIGQKAKVEEYLENRASRKTKNKIDPNESQHRVKQEVVPPVEKKK